MAEKKKSQSYSKSRKKAKKKKQDRFFIYALMVAVSAILIIAALNILGKGTNSKIKLPEKGGAENSQTEAAASHSRGMCRFDIIDVGQGDCSLITTPNGKFILVDSGTSLAENTVISYLEDAGADKIDYFILTHPHNDHIGSARAVLDKFKVNCIIMPEVGASTMQFDGLYNAIVREKAGGCKVYSAEPGDSYEIDGCTMNIIGPAGIDEEEFNNCSVAFMFTYGDFDAVFTGDTEADYERRIIAGGHKLDCELYKVAHHGSDSSSCEAFVSKLTPDISVISCGVDNSYGHPSTTVIQRLVNIGSRVFITSENGTVSVLTDGKEYSVYGEKQ